MGRRTSWRFLAVVVVAASASVVLRGCTQAPVSASVTYTDECEVTYQDGTQSGMEDCDAAVTQASKNPGASVQQLLQYPDGSQHWVPPTGDWGQRAPGVGSHARSGIA